MWDKTAVVKTQIDMTEPGEDEVVIMLMIWYVIRTKRDQLRRRKSGNGDYKMRHESGRSLGDGKKNLTDPLPLWREGAEPMNTFTAGI